MSLQKNIDLVSDLPDEIFELIFSDLPLTALLICRRVSKSWKKIAENDSIWRPKFQDQISWRYYNYDSDTDSWYELYKERYLLDLNWKHDRFTQHKLSGHSAFTFCVKFFKNWIITGSVDCTIRIWDNETYQCLKVLGEQSPKFLRQFDVPNFDILREKLSTKEILELAKDTDIKFHLDIVRCMDINDKYLVSGSSDGSCIFWKLSDFKPMNRLIIPPQSGHNSVINSLALYNDYIVCCDDKYITVWKSSVDDLEHQLQFSSRYRLKLEGYSNNICIHNDIIYLREFKGIRSWNIETGQIIQEIRNNVMCIAASDQYLFIGEYNTITVLDLQTNKRKIISSNGGPIELYTVDDKISVNESTINIWNLNDLKLFKEFKILNHEKYLRPAFSICADSKRLAAFTMNGTYIIYDFTEKLRKKYLKHL